ncbi:MAG: hypothetical protein JXA23_09840, partial [Bacteroidales bacterium]|nr:hypothetical protein [Bacteroidales bacterium]
DILSLFEGILESYKNETDGVQSNEKHQLVRTLARRLSISHGKPLSRHESSELIRDLMHCAVPEVTPEGKPTMYLLSFNDLAKKFKHTT